MNEPLLNSIAENLDVGIICYDPQLRLQYWNSLALTLLGAPSELFVRGRSMRDILAFFAERGDYGPGDVQALATGRLEWLSQATSRGPDTHMLIRPNASVLQVHARRSAEGSLVFRLSELFMGQSVIERIEEGVIFFDREQRIINFNHGAEQIFGWSADEVVGKPLHMLLPPRFHSRLDTQVKAFELSIGRTGSIQSEEEFVGQRKSGEEFPAEASLAKVEAESGLAYALILRDSSQRRQLERASRQSEAALRQAQKLAQLGYYRWSKGKQQLVSCNDEYMRILGLPPRKSTAGLPGMAPSLHPDDRERVIQAHRAAEAEGRGVQVEFRIVRPDGTVRYLRDLNEPEPNPHGPPEIWFGTVQDISDIKQRDDALRESEQRYRSVVSALSEGIVLQDADGAIQTCNESAERILGLTRDQMIGRTSRDPRWQAIREDGSPFTGDVHPAMVTLRTGKPCHDVIMGVQRPEGALVWISIETQPLFGGDGDRPRAVVASFADITERKRREAELGETRRRMTDAVRRAKLAYWSQVPGPVPNSSLYAWEEAADRIYGIPFRELPSDNRQYLKLVHPDDVERVRETYRRAGGRAEPYQLEYRILRPNGETVWIHEIGEMEPPESGRPVSYAGTVQDITELKLGALALQRLTRILKTLSRAKRALIRASDEHTMYQEACQAIVETGGYRMAWIGIVEDDPEKSIRAAAEAGYDAGYLDEAHITWRDVERGRGPTGKAARTGLPQVNRDFTTNPDTAAWRAGALKRGYRSNIALPLADSSRVFGVLTIYAAEPEAFGPDEVEQLTDLASDLCYGIRALRTAAAHKQSVAERQMLERSLQQTQKMEALGQLATGVAHDFNNLLTIICGSSELLLEKLPSGDPLLELATSISEAGERAISLTQQLLALSQRSLLQPKIVDLNIVVTDTQRMLRRLIGENITISTSLEPALHRVRVDPGHLQQVLINLAINARDAMREGGRLTIETANVELDAAYAAAHPDVAAGGYVMLAMTDTGLGMTPEIQARIFEPFFTTKEIGKGTGLGLAIVRGIVKQSGGHIEVYSEPGMGTTFKIYFPATLEAVTEAGVGARAPERNLEGIETVLFVEDEEGIRRLGLLALETHGYRTLVAPDGEEGLRVGEAHAGTIDLLITDVVMPKLGGRQLAEALRRRFPHLKILFTSGYPDDAIVRHGILQAEVAFLRKPYTPLGLLRKIREVLEEGPAAGRA